MATGPQRARLDQALSGAHDADIDRHAREWEYCQSLLQQISMALTTASPEVKERIGGKTGPAVDAAFSRSATSMGDKGAQLADGAGALRHAAAAIRTARTEQTDLQTHALSEPPAYQKPVGQPTKADLQAEAQNRQAHRNYQAAYADQESRAKAQADAMDRVFGRSADTMKRIHGEPDPEPGGSSGGGVGGGVGVGGGSSGTVSSSGGGGPRHADGPGADQTPGTPVPNPGGGNGAPQGGGPVVPVAGATGPTAVGGIGAGTGLGLAAAGGLLGTGMSAGGVRGIGATSRTGVAGTLGRPGGVGAVGSGSRVNGRSGSGSAAGRRGTTGGSRGAAGGRGTGSVASGRGGRDKDEKRRKRDVFDTGDEWVEDEDGAPGVLD